MDVLHPAGEDEQYDFGYYDVILPKEPFVWGVSHIHPRALPAHIQRPSYAVSENSAGTQSSHTIVPVRKLADLTGENNARLRRAASLGREVLEYAGSLVKVSQMTEVQDYRLLELWQVTPECQHSHNLWHARSYEDRTTANCNIQPGVTTDDIDALVHDMIIARLAYPSPLLYKGYPKSCCTSINNVVTHGIPDEFSMSPLSDEDGG